MLAKSPHLTVRDNQTNIVNTAEIEVFEAGTTNTVTVFSDSAGQSELTQPFPVTSKGVIQFYAEGGLYDVKITNDGDVTTLTDIQIGTAQQKDAPTGDSDLLDSVYVESETPPSNKIVWKKKSDAQQPMVEKLKHRFDSETDELVGYDKVLLSVADKEPVKVTELGDIFAGLGINTGSPALKVGNKFFYTVNGADTTELLSIDENLESGASIKQNVQFMKMTDRGVAVGHDDGASAAIDFYTTDPDSPSESVSFPVGVLGSISSFGNSRLSISGDYCVTLSNKVFSVYDITGTSAGTPTDYDVSSQTPDNDPYDFGIVELQNDLLVSFVLQTGTFDYSSASFLASDPANTFQSSPGASWGDIEYSDLGSLLDANGDDTDFTFLQTGSSDRNSTVTFTANMNISNLLTVAGGFLYFRNSDTGIYKVDLSGGSAPELVVESDRILSPTDNGDYLYFTDSENTQFYIMDKATAEFSTYDLGFDPGNIAILIFADLVNPKVETYLSVSDGWVLVGNNKQDLGVPESTSGVDLGQDLNAIIQEHNPSGQYALRLDTSETNTQEAGEYSVYLGYNTASPAKESIAIGNGAGNYENSSTAVLEGMTAIGNGASAYNAGSLALGDGAYASHESDDPSLSEAPIAIGNSSYVDGYLESIALGGSTSVYGSFSVAVGHGAYANANETVAIGESANISNLGGVGVGKGAYITGDYSVAVGNSSSVTGTESTGLGKNVSINSDYAVALGAESTVNGNYAVLMGYDAFAGSLNAVAVGFSSNVTGDGSVALGKGAIDNGNVNSVALGADTLVSSPNSVAIGDRQLDIQGDKGFRVQSPDGQQWDVTVDNTGNLVVTAFNAA